MKNYKALLYFLPALIVMLIIFWFSSKDIDTSNQQSGQITQKVAFMIGSSHDSAEDSNEAMMPVDILNLYVRMLAHVIEFGGFGLMIILGCILNKWTPKRIFHTTWIWGTLTAFTDEFIQYFTPGRTCDILDILKDLTGIFLALVFVYLLHKIYLSRRQKLVPQS